MPPTLPQVAAVDGAGAAQLLTAAFQLEQARRQEDMVHTQALLQGALEELDLARVQEERRLVQAAAALRREYEARMQALERRFLADAEGLQNQLREGTEREAQRSQAAIDAKARELLEALGGGSSGGSGPSWAALKPVGACSTGSGGWQHAVPAPPMPSAQPCSRKEAAPASKALLSPAVEAATNATAALRLAMPAVLRASSTARCRTAAGAAGSPAKSNAQAPNAPPRPPEATSSPGLQLPVPPAGLPNTAAARHASLQCSPLRPAPAPAPPPCRRRGVSFAAGADGIEGGACAAISQGSVIPPPAGVPRQPTPAPEAVEAQGLPSPHHRLEHVSSSEFDNDTYLSGESSGDADLASSRPPLVKTVNPGTPRSPSFAPPCGNPGARPGSSGGRVVHLNLASGSPSASFPGLRAYSPCTCHEGAATAAAAAKPRSGMTQVLGSSRLRASYSSD